MSALVSTTVVWNVWVLYASLRRASSTYYIQCGAKWPLLLRKQCSKGTDFASPWILWHTMFPIHCHLPSNCSSLIVQHHYFVQVSASGEGTALFRTATVIPQSVRMFAKYVTLATWCCQAWDFWALKLQKTTPKHDPCVRMSKRNRREREKKRERGRENHQHDCTPWPPCSCQWK